MGIFPADAGRIRTLLPSDALHPALLPDGRGAVGIGAYLFPRVLFRDLEGRTQPVTPYAAVGIFALCTHGRAAPRGAPFLQLSAPSHWRLGGFMLHMPETALDPVVGGRLVYNAPKFVADLDFVETPTYRRASVEEGGRPVLRLQVARHGAVRRDRHAQVFFTARQGELLRTEQRLLGFRQTMVGAAGGTLELGSHPVADTLRRLEAATQPFAAFQYVDQGAVLPAPETVGPARAYDGYRGEDRERGRWTITYPGTDPLDLYASSATTEGVDDERLVRS